MANTLLPDEDYELVRNILLEQRAAGVANPLLPADVDTDGDGIADSFGLNELGEVIVVVGAPLEETMFEATDPGDDIPAIVEAEGA